MTIAYSTEELKNQYISTSSGHWFDKGTMKFFRSRLTTNYRRLNDTTALFITTERGPFGPRKANLRKAELVKYIREDNRICYKIKIDTISPFNELTLYQAKKLMREYDQNI